MNVAPFLAPDPPRPCRPRRPRAWLAVRAWAVAALAAAFGLALSPGGGEAAAAGASAGAPPPTLAATGLYADAASGALAPGVLTYSPQYPLFSDGAAKRRFIALPAGTAIDAADPDHWVFPVGTRLWKEFSFAGRRVETRYMERRADGWLYAAYVWDAAEQEATLAPLRGIAGVAVGEGGRHDIPGRFDCLACHQGQPQEVLGFGALQLSPNRDPGALHAEPPRAGDADLTLLLERGLVANLPAGLQRPAIPGGPRQRAALGYLHANCAPCHNAASPLRGLELDFAYTLQRPEGAPPAALATSLGAATRKRTGAAPALVRIAPGDPRESGLLQRMQTRDPNTVMPTLGTRLVDGEAVALLEAWIREDLERR